jgi:hypothetical protein
MIRTGPEHAIGHSESGGFAPATPYNAAPPRHRATAPPRHRILLLACSTSRLNLTTHDSRLTTPRVTLPRFPRSPNRAME